jgi:hypothetical protein
LFVVIATAKQALACSIDQGVGKRRENIGN